MLKLSIVELTSKGIFGRSRTSLLRNIKRCCSAFKYRSFEDAAEDPEDYSDSFKRFEKPRWDQLPTFQKNFYKESISVTNRTQEEIDAYLKKHEMKVSGSDIPRPVFDFREANFPEYIDKVIEQETWQVPTPIQAQGWPLALSGKDMVGRAITGSGKTASFLLPGIVHIRHQPRLQAGDGPICLVMVPTRELAQQVESVAIKFGKTSRVRSVAVFGGASRIPQLNKIRRGAEICIATPGRLLDYIQGGEINMQRCTYLVLDEADRMLDMGFEPQIRRVIRNIRPDRQTLMWSATWPDEVKTLAEDYFTDQALIAVGSGKLNANKNIEQIVEICSYDKEKKFHHILSKIREEGNAKTLVFAQTKRESDRLCHLLYRSGFHVDALHGDKNQRERDRTLNAFRRGDINVLIATDVASRGLDVNDIKVVINYDFPLSIEDYIHRIGRTARGERKGIAYSLFTDSNFNLARDLIDVLKSCDQEVPEELYNLMPANTSKPRKFGNYRRTDNYNNSRHREYNFERRDQFKRRRNSYRHKTDDYY